MHATDASDRDPAKLACRAFRGVSAEPLNGVADSSSSERGSSRPRVARQLSGSQNKDARQANILETNSTDTAGDATDFYERRYASYAGHPGYLSETRYVDILLDLIERRGLVPLSRLRSYADLGCGLGFKTYAVARRFERSVGFDAAESAIALANRLNDLPALEFRVADVLAYEPEERFDFVTAFGLSVLNSADVGTTAERVLALCDRYLADRGVLLVVTPTDCSGSPREGWFNPSAEELRRLTSAIALRPRYTARLYTPQRDVRALVSFGPENALRELGKRVLRRPRDYCILVSRR
jgi:SAM-dependent methyltransferase